MKRLIIISTILLSIGMSARVEARHDHILPEAVVASLSHRYHHFDLIHAERIYRRGRPAFNLLLKHDRGYVEVTLGQRGRIFQETRHRHYPLSDHFCDNYCSFHYQHYENGRFASYDPYSGCYSHMDVAVRRHHRPVHRPYYGYGYMHYHPGLRVYKRFRPYHIPPSGYRVHRGKRFHRRDHYYRYDRRYNHGYGKRKYGNQGHYPG